MCGLAAIISRSSDPVSHGLCAEFDAALAHRGPDASGSAFFSGDGNISGVEASKLALLHRRLAIIDLDPRSNQPMSSDDGRYHLVFNGEIYNYVELRSDLQRDGWNFQTASDVEVLLKAFAAWGPDAIRRFVGMFAFALFDKIERRLILARDPFGIKPLYWVKTDKHIAVASEIAPLLLLPGLRKSLNAEQCADFLANGRTDAGGATMFGAIKSFPAASWAVISLDHPAEPVPQPYWSPTIAPRKISMKDAAQEVRTAFLNSISLHLRSDVPIGTALSGGIDSSAILLVAREVGGDKLPLRAFSFVATGSDVDETPFMEIAAAAAGAEHTCVSIQPADVIDDIDKLVRVQGEPFGSLSIYAQYRVMQLAGQNGIKVMLDGQGADELFAGYRPFLARRASELIADFNPAGLMSLYVEIMRLPQAGAGLLAQSLEPFIPLQLRSAARKLVARPAMPPWVRPQTIFDEKSLPTRAAPARLHDALVESLTSAVLPALLRYEDRNSMAFSIESRVPFLTQELADLAYSMPSDLLIGPNATSKAVLREALKGLVPEKILARRDKIGFATPDKSWAQQLLPWFMETLRSDVARELPWLDSARAMACLNDRVARGLPFGFDLWRTVNLIRWIQLFDVAI